MKSLGLNSDLDSHYGNNNHLLGAVYAAEAQDATWSVYHAILPEDDVEEWYCGRDAVLL